MKLEQTNISGSGSLTQETVQPGAAAADTTTGGEAASPDVPPQSGDSLDEASWDEATKAYIAKLRKESAKHRTKANKLEADYSELSGRVRKLVGVDNGGEELPLDQQVQTLEAHAHAAQFENAVLSLALEHGINAKRVNYFNFLMTQAVQGLEDGGELTAEDIQSIVKEARGIDQPAGSTSTSVTAAPKAPGAPGEVTLDQFVRMGIMEKSAMYQRNPELTSRLMQEAKAKGLLIKP